MKTVHTYNKYPEDLPAFNVSRCYCNRIATAYLDRVKHDTLCCTKCNIVYECLPGHDQVLTMFRDVSYLVDLTGSQVFWGGMKFSGRLLNEIIEDLYVVTPNPRPMASEVRHADNDGANPPPVKPKSTRDLYEEAYWNFVNAKTYDDALYWKNQMEHHVDLALEPDGENWSSWVKDPVVREEVKKKHYFRDPFYQLSAAILMCVAVAQLLNLLGILK